MESPEAPRRTRAALAEIPARLDRLRVTPLRTLTNTREVSPSLPPGYLSPAPSPDEFLIQQRGLLFISIFYTYCHLKIKIYLNHIFFYGNTSCHEINIFKVNIYKLPFFIILNRNRDVNIQ